MYDAEFDSYLDLLARFLRLSPRQRDEIRRELRAHLVDALADATSRGEPADAALRRVLNEFGDAAELAARFRTSHRNQRWIMHATLSAACVAFALVTFSFFSPPAQHASAARSGESDLVAARTADASADARIRAALAGILAEVNFQDQPLEQALQWLQTTMNVNVHVQWNALQDVGVSRDTPLTFTLKNVSAERVLRMVIDEFDAPIAYAIQDGVLTISTRERLRRHLRTQVYDVRDLLEMIPADAPPARGGGGVSTASPAGRSDAAKSAPASGGGMAGMPQTEVTPAGVPERAQRLVDLITRMVDPDTWEPNGGNATMEEFNGVLVIRQFDAVHSQVRELLDSLRLTLADRK